MKYVDGYVLAVPKNKLLAYKKMAKQGAKIWKKYGALEYFEAYGDDLNPKWAGIKFPKMINAKPNETVVFSFIVFKSKAHRNNVNKKVMTDPSMKPRDGEMPFDMKKMAYGGFKVMVEG